MLIVHVVEPHVLTNVWTSTCTVYICSISGSLLLSLSLSLSLSQSELEAQQEHRDSLLMEDDVIDELFGSNDNVHLHDDPLADSHNDDDLVLELEEFANS